MGAYNKEGMLVSNINDESDVKYHRENNNVGYDVEFNNGKSELKNDVNVLLIAMSYDSSIEYPSHLVNARGEGINSNSYINSICMYAGGSNCSERLIKGYYSTDYAATNIIFANTPGRGLIIPEIYFNMR